MMVQDEGCFGRISMPRRCWAPQGVRPRIARQVVREYIYVYRAVAPSIGKMTSLLLPYADTPMMNLFLTHLAQEFCDYFVLLQVDRAGWHDTAKLVVPENIRLILQPAYSPELNPVEHIWDYIREHYFHNWAAATLQQVIDRLIEALNQLNGQTTLLQSMTNFPHLRGIC